MELHWMKIYPGKMLLKVAGLSPTERGQYYEAVFHLWDAVALSRAELEARVGPMSEGLTQRFDLDETGVIRLRWLDDDRETQKASVLRNSLNRKGKTKERVVKPLVNPVVKRPPIPFPLPVSYPDLFLEFWKLYAYAKKKPEAFRAWEKLSMVDQQTCVNLTPEQVKHRNPEFIPYPATYLNNRMWEDEIIPATNGQVTPTAPVVKLGWNTPDGK